MNCPHCQKPIADSLVISEGSKLMRAKVTKRIYDPKKAKKAALIKWEKYYAEKKLKS
jgi:hypothetical protein